MCNRVARSLFDIGDQAGICAQLFYVKERSYGFEQELDVAIKVVMVMKDMICKKDISATGAHVILMTGRKALKINGFEPVFSIL